MARNFRILGCWIALVGCASALSANDFSPRITVIQSGATELLNDLEYVLGLPAKKEQKQVNWFHNIAGYSKVNRR